MQRNNYDKEGSKVNTLTRNNTEKSNQIKQVKRGEIYFAKISDGVGSEQNGTRPVIVLQNDVGNRFSPTTIVAIMTSIDKKSNMPTHVKLPKELTNLPEDSVILLEQIRTIDKKRLVKRMSILDDVAMGNITRKLMISLAINPLDFI